MLLGANNTLPAATLRNLGHKEYEKRKQAALEVETLVRDLRDAHDHEKITALVAQLGTNLAESPQSNLRKGALHALAGTAIGLRQNVGQLLPQLLQPVLGSFSDQDARVRYYGCEALYNIAKVARAGCVQHFNPIFDGLFRLSADTDISVQNGMQLLDRLMKDVVTEAEDFDIEWFMPLLGEKIYVSNPFSRQFLVGWISALDSVPDIDLLTHLPVFFDGLFHMLADPNKEIRQQTFSVLSEFLREIRSADQLGVTDLAPIVHVLVQHSESNDKFSRLTALNWLHTFVTHGREHLMPFCAQVLNAILASLSHPEDEIREAARGADAALRVLLQQSQDAQFEMHTLLHTLHSHLASQCTPPSLRRQPLLSRDLFLRHHHLHHHRLLSIACSSASCASPAFRCLQVRGHVTRLTAVGPHAAAEVGAPCDATLAADLARAVQVPEQRIGGGGAPRYRGAREDGADGGALWPAGRAPAAPLP